jgi:hypothetical protein
MPILMFGFHVEGMWIRLLTFRRYMLKHCGDKKHILFNCVYTVISVLKCCAYRWECVNIILISTGNLP